MQDPVREIIGGNAIDRALVESPELLGKECIGCLCVLPYSQFRRDSSYRDGHRDLCEGCANSPRLSTAEHTARLRERNDRSEGVMRQRLPNQEDYKNDAARLGRPLFHSDFIRVIEKLVPELYIMPGRIVGDWAVFRTYGQPQPRLDGRTFEYLFYIPSGLLPEFSLYEFNDRDIPVREKQRGWRTVLLRLIKTGLVSEATCNKVFGIPEGPGATVYLRTLYEFRNHIDTP